MVIERSSIVIAGVIAECRFQPTAQSSDSTEQLKHCQWSTILSLGHRIERHGSLVKKIQLRDTISRFKWHMCD